MPCYFIYDNLKAHPFILQDSPLPGFEILSWDSWTLGTMWDIGDDAGYTKIGKQKVHGQLWKLEDPSRPVIEKIREYAGIYKGVKEETLVTVKVPINDLISHDLQATTFSLSKIDTNYTIVNDGRWRF